ncbi:MAG TPA: hypothetical protein VFZ65_20115 [Planctomycetota bacterium]|nr:hypothetical protein [Planctomycetota bacterium]
MLVLLAIGSIAWLSGTGSAPGVPAGTATVEPTTEISAGPTQPASRELVLDDARASEPVRCRIRMVDTNRNPVPGVAVVEVPPHARWTRTEPLAHSDGSGRVDLGSLLAGASPHLIAVRDGYLVCKVDLGNRDTAPGETTVVMEAAMPQVLRVRDRQGTLMEGLILVASAEAISSVRDQAMGPGPWFPGGDPDSAVYRAVTNARGEAGLASLPRRKYHIATADEAWWVELRQRTEPHDLPADVLELVVVQPHVGVVEVDPAVPANRVTISGEGQDPTAVRLPEFDELRQRLRSRYPQHGVFVAVRSDGARDPMPLRGEAVTDQGSIATFAAAAVRLSEFSGPERVRLQGGSTDIGGAIRLTLDDSLRPFVDRLVFRAFYSTKDGKSGFEYLKPDTSNPVPARAYEFEVASDLVGRLVPNQQVEVAPGSEAHVHVTPNRPFRVVRLRTQVPDGGTVPGARILAIDRNAPHDKRTQTSFMGPWSGSCDLLLPAGDYQIKTVTAAYETHVTDLTVTMESEEPLLVPLKLVPKTR